jgi:hypothetical protein|tara:strand:- start:356 stop:895 length:540 start_codon:yes stop_codon:yes gene_type:complete
MRKYIGFIAFIGLTLGYIWGIGLFTPKPEPPTEGIPHNYWHPNIWDYDTFIIDTVDVIEEDGIRWYTLDTILLAIMFVESSYNDSAYRADEDAVGCLQIRKCMVNDVNRILKRQKLPLRFTYNSRWYRDSSIQMFEIYCNHYNLTTAEERARCWNGGPRGISNPATVGYWEKVKDEINS